MPSTIEGQICQFFKQLQNVACQLGRAYEINSLMFKIWKATSVAFRFGLAPLFAASPRYTPGFTLQSGLETREAIWLKPFCTTKNRQLKQPAINCVFSI